MRQSVEESKKQTRCDGRNGGPGSSDANATEGRRRTKFRGAGLRYRAYLPVVLKIN